MLRTGFRPHLIGGAIGLVVGVLLGMALFWGAWPVRWTNAHSYDLSPEAKAVYVALVADSYKLDRDYARAAELLDQWSPEEKQEAFATALQDLQAAGRSDRVLGLQDLQMLLGITSEPLPEPARRPPGILDRLRVPCLVFLVVLLILVLGWIGLRTLSKRKAGEKRPAPRGGFTPVVSRPPVAEEPAPAAPLGQWITTYKLGEDAYDESFPIETSSGDYLGECGVGISETIGAGEPNKVTAFEVWLFDKSDIRTVTKVLMSEHAFGDESLRARLASKGEALRAEVGIPITLATSSLRVQAQISELEYGRGDAAPNSFFSKLTVELSAAAVEPAEDEESLQ